MKIQCSECKLEREVKPTRKEAPRTPRGWHHQGNGYFCGLCWRKRYILRAVTMQIAAPRDGDADSWKDFRAALKPMWAATTQASNWIMTELYARDVRRNGEEKLPAMAPQYLYPEIRKRFPDLPSQTCAALEQAVKAKYRAKRYEVLWTCAASLPTYRYPTPFPIPNQGWSAAYESDRPVVSVRIGEARWSLRLKGGARFRRQMAAFRQIVSGGAVQGELALMSRDKDIMCKLVAWLPRGESKERSGVLTARSTAEELLVALNAKDEKLWTYNADHIVRWGMEHRRQIQRWAEDQKAEHRPVPPFAKRREDAAAKYRRRMDSACHQVAAMLLGYAERRCFAQIRWDDSDQSYAPQFPWFKLRTLIAEKADAKGIRFEYASGQAVEQTAEPLADPDL